MPTASTSNGNENSHESVGRVVNDGNREPRDPSITPPPNEEDKPNISRTRSTKRTNANEADITSSDDGKINKAASESNVEGRGERANEMQYQQCGERVERGRMRRANILNTRVTTQRPGQLVENLTGLSR